MFAILRTLVALAVGVAASMLFFANYDQTVVVYYWLKDVSSGPRSLSVVLFFAFLAGFVAAALAGIADQVRLRSRIRQMRRTIDRLEGEIGTARSLPVQPAPEERGNAP